MIPGIVAVQALGAGSGGIPEWVPADALVFIDFVNDHYWESGNPTLTYTVDEVILAHTDLVDADGLEVPYNSTTVQFQWSAIFAAYLLPADFTVRIEFKVLSTARFPEMLNIQSDDPYDDAGSAVQLWGIGTPVKGFDWERNDTAGRSVTAVGSMVAGTISAVAWTRTDARFAAALNGGAVTDSPSPVTNPTLTKVFFGSEDDPTNDFHGTYGNIAIRSLAVYAPRTDEDVLSRIPLEISGTPTTVAFVGAVYGSFTVASRGGAAPITFSISAGSLPTGLSIDSSTGVVSGTPSGSPGISSGIVIRATDATAATIDLDAFSITVNAAVGADWVLFDSQTFTTNTPARVYRGLDFNEIRILCSLIEVTRVDPFPANWPTLYIQGSDDNGVSFSTSNYYLSDDGVEDLATDPSAINIPGSFDIAGVQGNSEVHIYNWNLASNKILLMQAQDPAFGGRGPLISATTAFNALKIFPQSNQGSTVTEFVGGTLQIYVRNG